MHERVKMAYLIMMHDQEKQFVAHGEEHERWVKKYLLPDCVLPVERKLKEIWAEMGQVSSRLRRNPRGGVRLSKPRKVFR